MTELPTHYLCFADHLVEVRAPKKAFSNFVLHFAAGLPVPDKETTIDVVLDGTERHSFTKWTEFRSFLLEHGCLISDEYFMYVIMTSLNLRFLFTMKCDPQKPSYATMMAEGMNITIGDLTLEQRTILLSLKLPDSEHELFE